MALDYEVSVSSKASKMQDLGLSPITKPVKVHYMTQENFFTTQEGDDAKLMIDHGPSPILGTNHKKSHFSSTAKKLLNDVQEHSSNLDFEFATEGHAGGKDSQMKIRFSDQVDGGESPDKNERDGSDREEDDDEGQMRDNTRRNFLRR